GARVARTDPVELRRKSLVVAMGDHRRMQSGLAARMRVDEARALRRHQPFVAVADIPVDAKVTDVELHHAGRMRAIDQDRHAGGATSGDEVAEWKNQRGR